MASGTFLLPNGADRERMLDLDRQLRPVRRAAFGMLGIALVASGPWLGWWTLAPLVLAILGFRLADAGIPRMEHPEYALFAAWAASEAIMAVAVALSGGAESPTTAWFAIPVITLGARFSDRGIALGVGFALACLAGVELGVDPGDVAANPPLLIAPSVLIVCIALFQTVLARSEIRLRGDVVIDALTGMFNRKALERRVEELEQQSRLTLQPVGMIVCDLDRFKRVNDEHGHAAGDALLTDVSYRLRKALRAFDLAYRTGGEEFLVLLPGADLSRSQAIAEQLRCEVESLDSPVCSVTMSFGVAASGAGEAFDYETVFGRADAALYEAKRAGRNRVCTAAGEGAAEQLVPA